jgi:lysozyme
MPDRKYRLGDAGIQLIQQFEGLRLTSYQDQAGVWTIGYGTTRIAGRAVTPKETITEDDANKYLREESNVICNALDAAVPRDLTQNEVDALISFCYNLGIGAFRSSSLRKALVSGAPIVESLFTRWNKIRIDGVLQPSAGLTRRRQAEYTLFILRGV